MSTRRSTVRCRRPAGSGTAAGQLAEKVTGSESQDYRYDIRGQLTGAGSERRYGYDQNGRLISAVQPGLNADYRYDPAGNRVDGEGQQQFDNRPAKDSQWQYEYDAWGNLIKKSNEREKHLYTYDLLHRLTGFEKQTPTGTVTQARYQYDSPGRLTAGDVQREWAEGVDATTQPVGTGGSERLVG